MRMAGSPRLVDVSSQPETKTKYGRREPSSRDCAIITARDGRARQLHGNGRCR